MNVLKTFLILLTFFLLSILFTFYSCSFSSKSCNKLLIKAMNESYDIIIIPGCPLENGKWTTAMKARVYWSKYLYDKGIAKNIMYSGNAVYTSYYEAEVMALYAEAIGIPKEHIFKELLAEHSSENVYYSYKKSIKLGFKHIALASDPIQTRLLRNFIYRKVDLNIGLIPIVFDTLKNMEPTMLDPVIDYKKAFVKDFVPLTKRENFFKRFKGTRGKEIDTTAYN